MDFHSLTYILFLIIFLLFWAVTRKVQYLWIIITLSSFVLYGWYNPRLIILLAFSGLIDYWCALKIQEKTNKNIWLTLSILTNLSVLILFKSAIQIDDLNSLTGWFYSNSITSSFIIPIGISFYTFQSMSYTIDVYRGKLEARTNLFNFFSYLAFFPQLVAGPIVRARHFLPQIEKVNKFDHDSFHQGVILILNGLFLKMVVADNLADRVSGAFQGKVFLENSFYWWYFSLLFAIQIYCDFGGYCKIAEGTARLIGIKLPRNFVSPFISKSLTEFWKRWHISLTEWFRDYLYYPLVQKLSPSKLANSLIIIFYFCSIGSMAWLYG